MRAIHEFALRYRPYIYSNFIVFVGMDAATHLVAALEMTLRLTVSEGK